jgi:hypothetical protein
VNIVPKAQKLSQEKNKFDLFDLSWYAEIIIVTQVIATVCCPLF